MSSLQFRSQPSERCKKTLPSTGLTVPQLARQDGFEVMSGRTARSPRQLVLQLDDSAERLSGLVHEPPGEGILQTEAVLAPPCEGRLWPAGGREAQVRGERTSPAAASPTATSSLREDHVRLRVATLPAPSRTQDLPRSSGLTESQPALGSAQLRRLPEGVVPGVAREHRDRLLVATAQGIEARQLVVRLPWTRPRGEAGVCPRRPPGVPQSRLQPSIQQARGLAPVRAGTDHLESAPGPYELASVRSGSTQLQQQVVPLLWPEVPWLGAGEGDPQIGEISR